MPPIDPMPPIGHPSAAADAPRDRSGLFRIAFPLALVCSIIAEVMIAGLTLIGWWFQDYAGEAAADPVDYDGIATLACLAALVLAAACSAILHRWPALGSAGFAVVACAAPVVMLFSRDNVAGALVTAWVLPGCLLALAAIWGFVYQSRRVDGNRRRDLV